MRSVHVIITRSRMNTHVLAFFPLLPPASPHPIELIYYIGGVQKKVSQNPEVLAR